jgi:hypothetical protein
MSNSPQDDIEDIEACAREGRRPRDAARYRVLVGDGLLRYDPVIVEGALHTGRSLREQASLLPPDSHVIFAIRGNGLLEEVRLDESIDLRDDVVKLLAFRNDRIFRFVVDGREFQWGGPFISGATLLQLANVDSAHGITLRHPDGPRDLKPSDLVNLGEPGVETFVTVPAAKA